MRPQRPVRIRAAARASAGLIAALLAAPALLPAQSARVPAATVQRVMSSEFAFCGRAETATAAELDALDAEIRGAIDQAQRRVNGLVADSVAVAKRASDAQAKYDEVDGRLSPLQIERNKILAELKPIEDELARLELGTAQPGQQSEHAQLMARQTELASRIAFLTAEVEKVRQIQKREVQTRGDSVQDFFQGLTANEGPVADLRRAQEELKRVIERLREIRRETHPIRFGAQYTELHRRLADLERRIAEVEAELDTARRDRDTARKAREDFDLGGLEMAHEENLYAYEHFTRAGHCVQKRRQALAQAAPPVSPSMAGSATGQWGVFCRFTDPDYGTLTDGGAFRMTFDGRGGVAGTYQSSSNSYAVTGQVAADGSASGTGSGGGWSVVWSGRFGRQGSATVGGGNVAVTITEYGGGTCTGTWSLP